MEQLADAGLALLRKNMSPTLSTSSKMRISGASPAVAMANPSRDTIPEE